MLAATDAYGARLYPAPDSAVTNTGKARRPCSHIKTGAKVISWRIVAAIDSMAIGYVLTGSATIALGFVGIEAASKIVWMYCHERVWELPILDRIVNRR